MHVTLELGYDGKVTVWFVAEEMFKDQGVIPKLYTTGITKVYCLVFLDRFML